MIIEVKKTDKVILHIECDHAEFKELKKVLKDGIINTVDIIGFQRSKIKTILEYAIKTKD